MSKKITSELLKECIADAKAVRETAMANAKAALEEAFTPQLQGMLSKKLSEELEEDDVEAIIDEPETEEVPAEEPSMDSEEVPAEAPAETEEVPAEAPVESDDTVEIEIDESDEMEDDKDSISLESVIAELEDDVLEMEDKDEEPYVEGEESEDDILNLEIVDDEETMEESDCDSNDKDMKEEEVNLEEILRELEEETDESDDSSEMVDELRSENIKLKQENSEYKKVYEFLRGKLNEVNLLNAKLLYTNKIFKEHALTNDQKMRVVENFDRATNVREAKLSYVTISDTLGMSSSSKKPVVSKKKITEGLASKPMKSTKSEKAKEVITEASSEMAMKFKKLAGIIR